MDKVLNQMAEYDFNEPINVTLIFDDSDEDIDHSFGHIRERENLEDDNNNKHTCGNEYVNNTNMYKSQCLKNNCYTKFDEFSKNVMKNSVNNQIKDNINSKIIDVDYEHNVKISVPDIDLSAATGEIRNNPETNEDSAVQIFIEDLLNKLSEHLLLIIQYFYYYERKCNKSDPIKAQEYYKRKKNMYRFIKSHFFELSYATVESIILPQEHNNAFINQFLDNTILMAETKYMKWKCQKHHLQVLFDEIVMWAKQKKAHMNAIKDSPNENLNLRRLLTSPPQVVPFPSFEKDPKSQSATNTKENNMCIFRSGDPGSQICITVNSDTLRSYTQKGSGNTTAWNLKENNYAPNSEFPTRNTPVMTTPYNNSHHNRPPPSYPNQNFVPIQNRYIIKQPQQNYQNSQHPIQNYRTEVPCVNLDVLSSSDSDYVNRSWCNRKNINNAMQKPIIYQQWTSGPLITNVTSLNPNTYMNVRCCMCGKMTESRCSPYYFPGRPVYCSNLCQELDNQVRNSMYGSTYKPNG